MILLPSFVYRDKQKIINRVQTYFHVEVFYSTFTIHFSPLNNTEPSQQQLPKDANSQYISKIYFWHIQSKKKAIYVINFAQKNEVFHYGGFE